METSQLKLSAEPLGEEQLQEIERLQHGIAALDLFSEEVRTEERLSIFLAKSRYGSDTRTEILNGPSYRGDAQKLEQARQNASRGYKAKAMRIRLQAMYEHALYLGIDARIEKGMVVVLDKDEQKRLGLEHGNWRVEYASKARSQAREIKRDSIDREILKITGDAREDVWPAVNLEERAILLTRVVNGMARRSMLSGLGIGIADERYSEGIRDRYEDVTERVDRLSARKVDRLYKKARADYNIASGYSQVRGKGSDMSKLLMERRFSKEWKEFAGQFEHALQQDERVAFRAILRTQIPEDRLSETEIN